ncbi:MAG: histidine--tRNA ligase, partial [Ignavibacteriaceae bacterium]
CNMIKAITGTKDILPSEISKWTLLENIVRNVLTNFNYKEIRTPIFEETGLFARGIGEETDIVGKEMYTFLDRSETSITLKPEMTAAVVRSFIEHSLGKQQSLNKLFYISPMFRQERPQAGRLRQFHQFGAEAIGSTSVMLDAELIGIVYDILKLLGLKDLQVKINSLGVPESRENYKNELRKYLEDKKNKLSEDSRRRFDTNILRVFDSKVESDQEILKGAPLLIDHLDEESKNDFEEVKNYLKLMNIPFEVEPGLVRGLDYYTKTTFEILSGKVGSQSALCGGGRYDLLIEQLGGTPTPGVGFAAGIERILLACENEKSLALPEENIDIYIVRIDKELKQKVVETGLNLRRNRLSVEFDYLDRSVKAQMREANKLNSKFVLFIGGEEFKSGKANLKKMETGEQVELGIDNTEEIIKNITK